MQRIVELIERYWLILTVLVLVAITILSLWPLAFLPPVPGSDKTHHFISYAALMLPVAIKRPKYWLWIGVFFIAYSGAIELVQPYVNRYGEWLDLLANVGGVVCGIVLAKLMTMGRKR